jgi:hypothetical protein
MSYKIKFISEAQPRIVQIILLQPSLLSSSREATPCLRPHRRVVLLEEDYCIVLHIPGISDFILDFKLIYIYILNLKMVEAVLAVVL